MKLLGDVHGDFAALRRVCAQHPDDEILQIGDLGIGFTHATQDVDLPENCYFFRGNHDNPYWAKKHPKFVGDWGMWKGVFVLGGAQSVDKEWRTEGRNWWPDEELSYSRLREAIEAYREAQPRILVSHEAPFSIQPELKIAVVAKNPSLRAFGEPRPYPTAVALDEMMAIHRPEFHFFGHWHLSWIKEDAGTIFRCIDIMELVDVPE